MEKILVISFVVLVSIILVIGLFMISLCTLHNKHKFLQKLYVMFCEHGDYTNYKNIKSYIKTNKIKLFSNVEYAQIRAEMYGPHLDDEYYLVCFEDCVSVFNKYGQICLTSYFSHLVSEIVELSGYTYDEIEYCKRKNPIQHQKLIEEQERLSKELADLKIKLQINND